MLSRGSQITSLRNNGTVIAMKPIASERFQGVIKLALLARMLGLQFGPELQPSVQHSHQFAVYCIVSDAVEVVVAVMRAQGLVRAAMTHVQSICTTPMAAKVVLWRCNNCSVKMLLHSLNFYYNA